MLIRPNPRRQPLSAHTAECTRQNAGCMCIYAVIEAMAYSLRHQDPSTRIAMSTRHGQVPVAQCLNVSTMRDSAQLELSRSGLWLADSHLAPSILSVLSAMGKPGLLPSIRSFSTLDSEGRSKEVGRRRFETHMPWASELTSRRCQWCVNLTLVGDGSSSRSLQARLKAASSQT